MTQSQVRACAPTRIDLAGGTLDIWPLNLMFENPATVNMAISIKARASVKPRKDGRVVLVSKDQRARVEFPSLSAMNHGHRLGLLSRLAGHFLEEGQGVEIESDCEAPAGAGLAGSSALNIALCAALARLTGAKLSKTGIIETSRDIEAALLGIPTGLQDYAAAVYGSAHAYRFAPGGMEKEKFTKAGRMAGNGIALFYSGKSRSSGINNWEMFKRVLEKDRKAIAVFRRISDCATLAADALREEDMDALAGAVREEWKARKKLFPAISTAKIDKAIAAGMKAGANAARICGAGGGGCFFLIAQPGRRKAVIEAVEKTGCRNLEFSLSIGGLKIYN